MPGRATRTYHVFTGTTKASDTDIVLGEGQAMRFLSMDAVRGKELTAIARAVLFGRSRT